MATVEKLNSSLDLGFVCSPSHVGSVHITIKGVNIQIDFQNKVNCRKTKEKICLLWYV